MHRDRHCPLGAIYLVRQRLSESLLLHNPMCFKVLLHLYIVMILTIAILISIRESIHEELRLDFRQRILIVRHNFLSFIKLRRCHLVVVVQIHRIKQLVKKRRNVVSTTTRCSCGIGKIVLTTGKVPRQSARSCLFHPLHQLHFWNRFNEISLARLPRFRLAESCIALSVRFGSRRLLWSHRVTQLHVRGLNRGVAFAMGRGSATFQGSAIGDVVQVGVVARRFLSRLVVVVRGLH